MTHPTDDELDALVGEIAKLAWSNADVAADAITILRDQLAEANARAGRAEAALADADAMIEAQAKDHAENNIRLAEMSHRVSQLEGMVVSGQGEKIRLAADFLQAKIECNEANTRADRAEADRAAKGGE